ncbi:hypothetical protein PTKIN_Ptkin15bG0105700 [Pterospermum kingtungense]
MEGFKVFQLIAILSTISVISVNGQISTACTASMISSFTPCLNFITGSTGSANVSSPNQGCCGSLKSLMTSSVDCACLLITANVPFQLPINRTLALTLPRACNIGGVPVQCKAAGTPLPAPGPVPFLLPPPPSSAVSPSSLGAASAEGPAPQSDKPLDLIPASPPEQEEEEEPNAPTATLNPGIRPVLQPSASIPSYISPPSILVLLIGMTIFIRFY